MCGSNCSRAFGDNPLHKQRLLDRVAMKLLPGAGGESGRCFRVQLRGPHVQPRVASQGAKLARRAFKKCLVSGTVSMLGVRQRVIDLCVIDLARARSRLTAPLPTEQSQVGQGAETWSAETATRTSPLPCLPLDTGVDEDTMVDDLWRELFFEDLTGSE